MKINELAKKIHKYAKEKGWWDQVRSPLEIHMLIVSEIAEATEAVRDHRGAITGGIFQEWKTPDGGLALVMPDGAGLHFDKDGNGPNPVRIANGWNSSLKPEGELTELADTIIRILDYCESKGWDMEKAIELKLAFNKTRAHRHGGKKY